MLDWLKRKAREALGSGAITPVGRVVWRLIKYARFLKSFTGRDVSDPSGRDLADSDNTRDLKDFTGRDLHDLRRKS